jgi:hypothetical protein
MVAGAATTLGLIVAFIGMIMFLVAAFKESPVWGIACLLCGPASLLFIVLHLKESLPAVFVSLIGYGLIFTGFILGADFGGLIEQK